MFTFPRGTISHPYFFQQNASNHVFHVEQPSCEILVLQEIFFVPRETLTHMLVSRLLNVPRETVSENQKIVIRIIFILFCLQDQPETLRRIKKRLICSTWNRSLTGMSEVLLWVD